MSDALFRLIDDRGACKWTREELTGYWIMTRNTTQLAADVVFDMMLRDGLIVPVNDESVLASD